MEAVEVGSSETTTKKSRHPAQVTPKGSTATPSSYDPVMVPPRRLNDPARSLRIGVADETVPKLVTRRFDQG
jgi:hypothetical protein